VLRHIRNYVSAGMISALCGVISFPIMTRSLSVADYGTMGLIASTLALFAAVGKLGLQHAVIRFFAQVRHGNIDFTPRELNSTVSVVFLLFATLTTIAWLVMGNLVLPDMLESDTVATLFNIVAGVVFFRLLGSGAMNFLRAQQRSGVVAGTMMIARGVNLALIVALLLFGEVNLAGLFVCLLLAEIASVGHSMWRYRADFTFAWRDVSIRLGRSMLVYGAPLMLLESLGLVLRLSDRYVIEALLGVDELGQYSASYNLVAYLDVIVLAALMQAVKPMYVNLWESEGKEATRAFLSSGLRLFLVIGAPFVAVFSLTSPHLLSVLAGERYAPGTVIIPLVTLSFLVEGTMHFLAAGLFLRKETRSLMIWSAIATVVNLGLNFALVPVLGIVGAALVTILSYSVFIVGVTRAGFRHLSFRIPCRGPIAMAALSLLVYEGLAFLTFGSDLMSMVVKGALSTVMLGAALLAFDAPTRTWIFAMIGRPPRASAAE